MAAHETDPALLGNRRLPGHRVPPTGPTMGCPACTTPAYPTTPAAGLATAHENIESRTQFASPDLIGAIVYDEYDRSLDPLWPTSGAADVAEYVRWSGHCCGMSCLQMILQHRDGTAPALLPLLRGALEYGGYIEHDDGSIKGLIYAPFVRYITAEFGLTAEVRAPLPLTELVEALPPVQLENGPWTGRLVMASVHREIRRPQLPAPGQGGHLVLITGHDPATGTITFNNPSGHTPDTVAATLPIEVFATFYAGRGVVVTLTT